MEMPTTLFEGHKVDLQSNLAASDPYLCTFPGNACFSPPQTDQSRGQNSLVLK